MKPSTTTTLVELLQSSTRVPSKGSYPDQQQCGNESREINTIINQALNILVPAMPRDSIPLRRLGGSQGRSLNVHTRAATRMPIGPRRPVRLQSRHRSTESTNRRDRVANLLDEALQVLETPSRLPPSLSQSHGHFDSDHDYDDDSSHNFQ